MLSFLRQNWLKVKAIFRHHASSQTWLELKRSLMFFRRGRSRLNNRLGAYKQMSPSQKKMLRIKIMRWAAVICFGAVLLGILVFFALFAYYSRDLPKPGQVVRKAGFSTKIYDRNGVLLYDLFDDERRNPIRYDQLPENLKNAVVAIEDKDFYKHGGFDFMTILRIPYNAIVRHRVVGGSTLTQQLVKNSLLSNERTMSRKFKELVLSIQIERTFTKEQILEMYLNEAPYGGTAWGIGTASEIYFNKPVSDLSLVESAFLAGLPQRPSAYSPYSGKKDEDGEPLWKMRTRGVLNRMKEDGYVTDLAYEEAMSQVETLTFEKTAVEIKAPHFVFYVKDQLTEMFGEELVEKGGLIITTTLDLDLYQKSQQVVAEEIKNVEKYKISNGAAMVMNPESGEILSMVGSKDYFAEDIDGQYNVAADGLRQPGSSIKPVTYLAMIRMGYTPATMLADVATTFAPHDKADKYEPKNYDGKFHGPVNLRNSLGSSLNIPAVKSLAMVGVPNFLQLAYDMGFKTLEPTEANLKRFGLAVTLGGAEVHLIDTVSAYSSFANGGLKVEPVSILKVADPDGKVLYEHKPVAGTRVFSEEESFLINNILSDNNARLMAFGPNSLLNTGKPIAVKTGTTNDQRDNWTIGWSQKIMVGVWVGNNDNSEMSHVASGITGASPIWRKIITAAMEKGYEAPAWKVPEGVEEVEVDSISGYAKHDDFPSHKEYVIKGTLPASPDPIHLKAKVCRGENKLANEARVATGDFEEKEVIVMKETDPVSTDGKNRWEEGIMGWINSQDDSRFKYPTEYCGESGDVTVRISRPENEKVYSEEDVEVHIDAGSDDGIEKIELWVDGNLRETINSYSYRGKVHLSSGQHELYAKVKSRGGKEATSSTVKIGTGGQDWKRPDPTATPAPTAVPPTAAPPTLAPTIAPTVAPTVAPPTVAPPTVAPTAKP